MFPKKIFNALLDLFFPNLCVVCEKKLVEEENFLCLDCLTELPKTNNWIVKNNKLEQTLAGRFSFEHAASFAYFVKNGSMQRIIHELKYKNNPRIGEYMGRLCGKELSHTDFLSDIDFIVPVPLHSKRLKMRGYNQSLELAKGISAQTKIHVFENAVQRIVNNKTQTKNSRIERWNNVENIFRVVDPNLFTNKHVLLIDDVITTGSTLESCAREILKNHRSRLSIFALASVD